MREEYIKILEQQIGKPYIWRKQSPLVGFDCSGLVIYGLWSVGELPRVDKSAQMLFDHYITQGNQVYGPNPPKRGDLCFFGASKIAVSHVTTYLGNGLMIEAGGGDSTCINLAKAIEMDAYVRIRPITWRKDFLTAASIF